MYKLYYLKKIEICNMKEFDICMYLMLPTYYSH